MKVAAMARLTVTTWRACCANLMIVGMVQFVPYGHPACGLWGQTRAYGDSGRAALWRSAATPSPHEQHSATTGLQVAHDFNLLLGQQRSHIGDPGSERPTAARPLSPVSSTGGAAVNAAIDHGIRTKLDGEPGASPTATPSNKTMAAVAPAERSGASSASGALR